MATDQSLVEYGEKLLEIQFDEAIKQFHQALEINPHNWLAWRNLAIFSSCTRNNLFLSEKIEYRLNQDFMTRDIAADDVVCLGRAANSFIVTTDIYNGVTILNLDGRVALCGTQLIQLVALRNDWRGNFNQWSMDSIVAAWERTATAGKKYLANALNCAPEQEKSRLQKMSQRLYDYPKEFLDKLCLPRQSTIEEQRRKKRRCAYCGEKLGWLDKVCRACGKAK
jgi:tetratricopeptide (TPR) repeat protein